MSLGHEFSNALHEAVADDGTVGKGACTLKCVELLAGSTDLGVRLAGNVAKKEVGGDDAWLLAGRRERKGVPVRQASSAFGSRFSLESARQKRITASRSMWATSLKDTRKRRNSSPDDSSFCRCTSRLDEMATVRVVTSSVWVS